MQTILQIEILNCRHKVPPSIGFLSVKCGECNVNMTNYIILTDKHTTLHNISHI